MHGPDDGHRLAVAQDGIVEEVESFLHASVAGDDEAGGPVAIDYEFVKIGGLLGGELVQSKVVQDEQVWGQESPESTVHRVVHPGQVHGPEEIIDMDEADSLAGTDS